MELLLGHFKKTHIHIHGRLLQHWEILAQKELIAI